MHANLDAVKEIFDEEMAVSTINIIMCVSEQQYGNGSYSISESSTERETITNNIQLSTVNVSLILSVQSLIVKIVDNDQPCHKISAYITLFLTPFM